MKAKNWIRLALAGGIVYFIVKQSQDPEVKEIIGDLRRELTEELSALKTPKEEEAETGLANPYKDLSFEELREKSGLDINLEGLEDPAVKAYMIDAEDKIYGTKLRDSDVLWYDFRFASKGVSDDISGMYYSWTEEQGYPAEAPECQVKLSGSGEGVCSWEDGERKYTLSMDEGASLVKLVWMRKRLMGLISQ